MVRCRFDDLVAGTAFELTGFQREIGANHPEEVPALLRELERESAEGRFAAGFVAYESAPGFDAALKVRERVAGASPLPLAWFAVFTGRSPCSPVEPTEEPLAASWSHDVDEGGYSDAIVAVKEQIAAGWTYQVNLTSRLTSPYESDPYLLYRQLATAQRGPYHCYLETDSWAIACGSPELFFSLDGAVVTSRPMKGTAARGRWPEEDRRRAEQLRSSPKERAENVMIVDLIRNDLGRVATFGSVEVPELFSLERYPTVWQLTSTVRARLQPRDGLASVFGALFPCGSVTGAPKGSTMRLIAQLERSERGVYCGAIGYVAPSGAHPHARFAVAIRTAVVDRDARTATYGVGGGVTWDSTSAGEWAEMATKAVVLESPTANFGLFETFRYEPGLGLVNLPGHLSRLAASAEYFGFRFAYDAASQAAENAVRDASERVRVRLVLERDGTTNVETQPFPLGATRPLRLAVDLEAVDHSDPMLFHKTTNRARYDERSARHPAADDVVLINERSEVTETTRANLLVRLDGKWWTPAIDCGLLPGVERARLIEAGTIGERAISLEELRRAEAIETVSSLRGRTDARLVGNA